MLNRLFDMVLWPIIEPLTIGIEQSSCDLFKSEIKNLFFQSIQKQGILNGKVVIKHLPKNIDSRVSEFIIELIRDFTMSFYDDLLRDKSQEQIISSLNLLIYQQIIIAWINYIIEKSITPLLLLAVKTTSRVDKIKQFIARVLLAISQDNIQFVEAENQLKFTFQNEFNMPEELILFITSFIKTFAKFKEKYGLEELAKIGEQSLRQLERMKSIEKGNLIKAVQDPIFDREKILNEWTNNILEPACIALRIAGNEPYLEFVTKSKKLFELFLDKILTSEDFEKRLDKELRSFGGDDDELIKPIRESITNSVRFLELARIDDPSLGLLISIIDEEREGTKRTCI
ncbi:MAG: hypothetical protein FK730_02900 [Asgard group archaeon]|nr:hypothetical protein [Asgard group archaeon]